MITERDRILAAILCLAEGPVAGQAEAYGWTDREVQYGNKVLRSLANAIKNNMHHMLSEDEVKRILAEGGTKGGAA